MIIETIQVPFAAPAAFVSSTFGPHIWPAVGIPTRVGAFGQSFRIGKRKFSGEHCVVLVSKGGERMPARWLVWPWLTRPTENGIAIAILSGT